MPLLSIRDVHRAFGSEKILTGINLELERGEILCLLGASGSGKSTLLRIIAGLEKVDQGDVLLEGRSILALPPHQRDFGLMFQDFALFPHMNVSANVAFGLRMRHMPADQQRERIQEMLSLVGLTGFERRETTSLSGGEKQRVALARSLAPNPSLLMLDEPLGSLDAALRDRLVEDLRTVIKRVGLTAIYVTHDQREAFAVADRIAIMGTGQIMQVDTPANLYRAPRTTFIARFLGLNNIIPVIRWNQTTAHTPLGDFSLTVSDTTPFLLLHPNGISLQHTANNHPIWGTITECVFQGDSYRLTLAHPSGNTITLKHPSSATSPPLIGSQTAAYLDPAFIVPVAK